MISFRYHLVTIVAIFLALGLGLLAGTTVVNQQLVNGLKARTNDLSGSVNHLQDKVSELEGELSHVDAFANAVLTDQLPGQRVVIVTYEGADGAMLRETEGALKLAGVSSVTVLPVTSRMAASDPGTLQGLAKILGAPPGTPAGDLPKVAAQSLADRLIVGAPRSSPNASTDVLAELINAGFVRGGDIPDSSLADVGGRGQIALVLAGGATEPDVPPERFMVPLVEALVKQGVDVAAGESSTTAYPFVGLIRSDGAVDGSQMVTVDNLEQSIGGAALVLGLNELVFSGKGGDYGVDGDSLIPAPAP